MTTQNLYNDLHRRSSGWDEDFLTEALIHLIKYMQKYEADAACTILNRLTGNLLRTVKAKMSEVVISTQYATEFGYPDICLRHPDFLVLIEVKVDADFHDGQLEGYREVLSRSGLPNVRLNTLTRYGKAGDRSEVDLAGRWNQVADWLDLRDLTNQIARYLHYLSYTPAQPFGYRVLHAALQWVPLGDHDMSASHFKILTWHSINVNANTYNGNDQIAFAADLRTLHEAGARIWPLAEALMALDAGTLPENVVVLTADDGAMLDFLPFEHPSCGPQPGLYRILREFVDEVGPDSGHHPHLSCFAIASPDARAELDRKDFLSLDVWHDRWWADATAIGLLAVESHSWDHNHPSLDRTAQRDNIRGDFRLIDTEAECRAEVDQASDYIEQRSGRRPRFLAFPWGHASDYLIREYLPRFGPGLGLMAALGVRPEPVTAQTDRWNVPRYMFNHDWKIAEELRAILRS